jgi:hypothetical protein
MLEKFGWKTSKYTSVWFLRAIEQLLEIHYLIIAVATIVATCHGWN